ncbi:hypothetical protein IMCC20628_01446 [Hoeflea sp. IMCC20628]|uniref:hypothetical protein n=1 Tax=Hoeflea sp. IMCC20628 TaxID=1620421 RepID=UPI00063A948D|nr:hypothetical protein [Hoeflea sp. IMCC20628]AKI00163.1 hypothetical protein IMCC20628_01446 [Hoeflea sp. IMCC20628]
MRHMLIVCLASLVAFAAPAASDCATEIDTLFRGGAWDPFTRGNRHETTIVRHTDGTETASSDVLWDGPLRSINCTPHGCFMAIGNASWQGPTFDGPWTRSNDTRTGDPEDFVRATSDRLAASVSEPECLGATELDGDSAKLFRFFSKPEPNEYGSWWGGRYSVWTDPEGKSLLRIELSEGIASWAPEPSNDVQVTTIVYDDAIEIAEPK